jgi:hypothetical protein
MQQQGEQSAFSRRASSAFPGSLASIAPTHGVCAAQTAHRLHTTQSESEGVLRPKALGGSVTVCGRCALARRTRGSNAGEKREDLLDGPV